MSLCLVLFGAFLSCYMCPTLSYNGLRRLEDTDNSDILNELQKETSETSEMVLRQGITKVVVPSIWKEFDLPGCPDCEVGKPIPGSCGEGCKIESPPQWLIDKDFQKKHGYTVVRYQKHDPRRPHYISANRGTEGGVYLRFIVDHYYNFPDVALFVHAHPHKHQDKWFEFLQCVKPTITYASINLDDTKGKDKFCRDTTWFDVHATWIEQCWRDVLRFVWHLQTDPDEFYRRLPIDKPINVCFHPNNQFFLSREQVHKRTLNEWKELLHMLGEDSVCHRGNPDYEHLYDALSKKVKRGPENPNAPSPHDTPQGWTNEHLAHVIFGQLDLEAPGATIERLCEHIYPKSVCPASPCEG